MRTSGSGKEQRVWMCLPQPEEQCPLAEVSCLRNVAGEEELEVLMT